MMNQRYGDREREGVSGDGAEVEGEIVYTVIVIKGAVAKVAN